MCAGGLLLAAAIAGCGGSATGTATDGKPAADKPAAAAGAAAGPDALQITLLGYVGKVYPGDLASTADGLRAALRQLGLRVTDESGGIFERRLWAESADGTSLVAIAKEVGRGQTRVDIKVGYLLGDRDAARRIHSELDDALQNRRAEADDRRRRWHGGATGAPGADATAPAAPPATPPAAPPKAGNAR